VPSSKAANLAMAFGRAIGRLNRTRVRADDAWSRGVLRGQDIEVFYCGLFLQLVVAYEACIEEFVLGLIVRPGGVQSSVAGVSGRLSVRSYVHALSLASGPNKDFADWLSKDHLMKRSALLLRLGRPFSGVANQQWDLVEKARFIRNAIAHPSDSAKEKFERLVIGSTPLPSVERSVGGYLRGSLAGPPRQTRWELYAAELNLFVLAHVK
jgi:hypothetical protein